MKRLGSLNFDLLKSKVVLIVTGSVIVLLLVWWLAWMTPEGSKLSTVQQQVATDKANVSQLNLELATLKAEKKLVLKELPYLKKVTAAIPPTEDPPGIVDEINTLAQKTQCNLQNVTPADTPSASGVTGLSLIPVSFSITGSHKHVFLFLSEFYALTRLMTINTVSLAATSSAPNILAVGDGQAYSLAVTADAYTTEAPPAPVA